MSLLYHIRVCKKERNHSIRPSCTCHPACRLHSEKFSRLVRIGIIYKKIFIDTQAFLHQNAFGSMVCQSLDVVVPAQMPKVDAFRPVAQHFGDGSSSVLIGKMAFIPQNTLFQ